MAYTAPDAAYVRRHTRLGADLAGIPETELDARIEDAVPDAEAELAGYIGEDYLDDATISDRVALRMRRAVALLTGEIIAATYVTMEGNDDLESFDIDREALLEARNYYAQKARRLVLTLMAGPFAERAVLEDFGR